jgi:hypothetical protein
MRSIVRSTMPSHIDRPESPRGFLFRCQEQAGGLRREVKRVLGQLPSTLRSILRKKKAREVIPSVQRRFDHSANLAMAVPVAVVFLRPPISRLLPPALRALTGALARALVAVS